MHPIAAFLAAYNAEARRVLRPHESHGLLEICGDLTPMLPPERYARALLQMRGLGIDDVDAPRIRALWKKALALRAESMHRVPNGRLSAIRVRLPVVPSVPAARAFAREYLSRVDATRKRAFALLFERLDPFRTKNATG